MARATITPTQLVGPYGTPVSIGTGTAMDASNYNQFVLTGREILIVQNSGATSRTVTLESVADGRTGRTGDKVITLATQDATYVHVFTNMEGWRQADGYCYLTGSHAEVLAWVLRLPATF